MEHTKSKFILTAKGLNCHAGRLVITRAMRECFGDAYKTYVKDKSIVLFTLAEYEIDEILRNAALELGFPADSIFVWNEYTAKTIPSDKLYDFTYVTEGNPYDIAIMMMNTGAVDTIRRSVAMGGHYIGSSAGAMLAGSLSIAELVKEPRRILIDSRMFDGLNILPKSLGRVGFLPHYTKKAYDKWKSKIPAYKLEQFDDTVYIANTKYRIYEADTEPSFRIFDSHAHLDFFSIEVINKLLCDSGAKGVTKIVVPAITMQSNEQIARLFGTAQYDGYIYQAVGLHPKEACNVKYTKSNMEYFNGLCSSPQVVALKTGLDYSKQKLEEQQRENQRKYLKAFIMLAASRNLPLVIHSRDAMSDFMDIWDKTMAEIDELNRTPALRACPLTKPEAIIHCYNSQDWSVTRKLIEMGVRYFGIGGKITKGDEGLVESVRNMPAESILLETDAPWVRPEGYEQPEYLTAWQKENNVRMSMNTPATLPQIAEAVAKIRGCTTEEILEQTFANACRVYKCKDF